MKALILAAGKGVRMRPLTLERPKVLIEVAGKPFLYYVINNLKKAGFNEFGIIAGYKKNMIEDFVKKEKINARILIQEEQLGTGHAVLMARKWAGKDNFFVVMGDNLYSETDMKNVSMKDKTNYIFGMKSDHPERYGVLKVEGEHLEKIIEKPKEFVSDIVNIGMYKFTPEIFSKLERVEKSPRGEIELTDAVTMLSKEKKVKVIKVEGYWKEMSTFEDLHKTEKFIIDNNI